MELDSKRDFEYLHPTIRRANAIFHTYLGSRSCFGVFLAALGAHSLALFISYILVIQSRIGIEAGLLVSLTTSSIGYFSSSLISCVLMFLAYAATIKYMEKYPIGGKILLGFILIASLFDLGHDWLIFAK